MKQFTAIVHQGELDEGGFWATCLEVPGANGQGETKDDCLRNLAEAVKLLLELLLSHGSQRDNLLA
jgi:predicted RNase H-like HicB family nuclease